MKYYFGSAKRLSLKRYGEDIVYPLFRGVDCDGDKLLVIKDRLLTKVAKRNMQGIVPLYYEMKKAKANLLTSENIYNGMALAFTSGNIGPISNLITIVHNNGEEDREEAMKVVKWLTLETNYTIDAAKTLYFLTRPKEVDKIIKKHTQQKLPNFFIYAKDKLPEQVEAPNDSTMNRIMSFIPNPRINFNKTISKFDYRNLMNLKYGFSIEESHPIIQSYNYWNTHQEMFNEQDSHIKDQDLYKYKKIRAKIIEEAGDYGLGYIVNTLVVYLYTIKRNASRRTLWACFGDIILENIKQNVEDIGKICCICGKRFQPRKEIQNCCSFECAKELNRRNAKNRKKFE